MYAYAGPETARLQKLKIHAEERRDVFAKKEKTAGGLAIAGFAWFGTAFLATSLVGWSSLVAQPYPHTIVEAPLFSPQGALLAADALGLSIAPIGATIETVRWARNKDFKQQEERNIVLLSLQLKLAQEGVLK